MMVGSSSLILHLCVWLCVVLVPGGARHPLKMVIALSAASLELVGPDASWSLLVTVDDASVTRGSEAGNAALVALVAPLFELLPPRARENGVAAYLVEKNLGVLLSA